MIFKLRWLVGLAVCAGLCGADALAANPLSALKIIRKLPQTEAEVAAAHDRAAGMACEHIPPGQPLEITSFVPQLSADAGDRDLPIPTSRRAVLSVGLDMLEDDRADLPTLTGGRILSYIDEHYVAVEVRVQRDLDSGELHLHHRPMAATLEYHGAHITQPFVDLVSDSIQQMRSLGLWTDAARVRQPSQLRTLVMLHKNMLNQEAGRDGKPRAVYEFMFVRARPAKRGGDSLDLHTFATTQQRQWLHYLDPFRSPQRAAQCGIRGSIYFSEYKVANLLPSASATRRTSVRAAESFPIDRLDDYAARQGWSGGALEHLADLLDAVIDGKIPASRPTGTDISR
ncbi:MAG TPA: hypothetical protein VHV55_17865 [Pirellulales bacterium]|jgi:hypothetical protein|nr:hypothetical protein [Pirellulales bacterium]